MWIQGEWESLHSDVWGWHIKRVSTPFATEEAEEEEEEGTVYDGS